MCNEFGEAIAIISTSEGEELPLEQALEIYHTALENSLAVDGLHLLWALLYVPPPKNKTYNLFCCQKMEFSMRFFFFFFGAIKCVVNKNQ